MAALRSLARGWLSSDVPLSLPASTTVTSEGSAESPFSRNFRHCFWPPFPPLSPPRPVHLSLVGYVLFILLSRKTDVIFCSVTITKLHLWVNRSMDIK